MCLFTFIFVSGSSDRVQLLSTGEGGRGTWVGASARGRGIIWPGASGGGVGSSVVRSARRAAGGMTSAGWCGCECENADRLVLGGATGAAGGCGSGIGTGGPDIGIKQSNRSCLGRCKTVGVGGDCTHGRCCLVKK